MQRNKGIQARCVCHATRRHLVANSSYCLKIDVLLPQPDGALVDVVLGQMREFARALVHWGHFPKSTKNNMAMGWWRGRGRAHDVVQRRALPLRAIRCA
jgi:hypothetical protein